MPFDFNVAMDVLEKLTPEERECVLSAMNGMLGPIDSKVGGKEAKVCWWAKNITDLKVHQEDSGPPIELRSRYRGSYLGGAVEVVRRQSVWTVEFKCYEGNVFGVQVLHMTPEEKQKMTPARKVAKQLRSLDQLEFIRKERDIL